MKFALTLSALTVLTAQATNFHAPLRASAAKKVLSKARRMEENDQYDEDAWMADYKVKFVGCNADTNFKDQDGNVEYGIAMFRLCPADSCDDDARLGCSEGYGDYVVGLNSFVQGYMEGKEEEQGDDGNDFNLRDYAECREYEQEVDDDQANADDAVAYFIGPACTEDGDDIKLQVYSDEDCKYESETDFEEIANGWTLPYSDGGLVSTYCDACYGANDNGEYEVSEYCKKNWEEAGKCETNMATFSDNGQYENYCETVESVFPKVKSGSAGKVFGWFVFILVVAGIAAYCMWWNKKKASSSDGVMA